MFKNYVKRPQDHRDCLSAFEEHFLDQESHWPAMVKVRAPAAPLRPKHWFQWSNSGFAPAGPERHVPAGHLGGGDHPGKVLPESCHRQEQKAVPEPEGISPRWRAGLDCLLGRITHDGEVWSGTASASAVMSDPPLLFNFENPF